MGLFVLSKLWSKNLSSLDRELVRRLKRLKSEEHQLTLMILDQKALLASSESHLRLTQKQIEEVQLLRAGSST